MSEPANRGRAPGGRTSMDAAALSALVVNLFAAIKALSGHPPPAVPPEIHFVPQTVIQERFCRGRCELKALYDPTSGIFLDESLDVFNDDMARSILLHELVHHSQAASGRFDLTSGDCTRYNRAEREAYGIQNRYLMMINSPNRVAMTGWSMRCPENEVPTPKR